MLIAQQYYCSKFSIQVPSSPLNLYFKGKNGCLLSEGLIQLKTELESIYFGRELEASTFTQPSRRVSSKSNIKAIFGGHLHLFLYFIILLYIYNFHICVYIMYNIYIKDIRSQKDRQCALPVIAHSPMTS